jgi:hypothetical protein
MRLMLLAVSAFALAVAAGSPADDGGGSGGYGSGDSGGAKMIQLDPANPGFAACLRAKLGSAVTIDTVADTATIQPGHESELHQCYTGGSASGQTTAAKTVGAIIVSNPLDLGPITALSAFRSCAGHDYSGLDVQGVRESDRSMKHYVITSLPLEPADAMKGYAPFAGTVTATAETFPLGKQIRVTAANGWTFVFFHGDLLVAAGKKVKAGQPVAAWPPRNARQAFQQGGMSPDSISTFDIAFQSHGTFDSPFLHMTPRVATLWATKGFTAQSVIVSKDARDAQPCNGVYNATHSGAGFVSAAG